MSRGNAGVFRHRHQRLFGCKGNGMGARFRLGASALLLGVFFGVAAMAQPDNAAMLRRVLENYAKAHGTTPEADNLVSVSLEGTMIQEGREYDLRVRRKRPHSIRYRLSRGTSSVVCGFDGEQAWMRRHNGGEVIVKKLPADARSLLRAEAAFVCPLLEQTENPELEARLHEVRPPEEGGVYVIDILASGERRYRYHLDSETYYVRLRRVFDGDGELRMETRYRDYRLVDGFPFAFGIENRDAVGVVSTIRVSELSVNSGLLSFLFEKPSR